MGFAERFQAIWLEAMSDTTSRLSLMAFFGSLYGFGGWWVCEKLFKTAAPMAKSWLPYLIGGLGVPFSAMVAALVPGFTYAELSPIVSGFGALVAKGSHDLSGAWPKASSVKAGGDVLPPPSKPVEQLPGGGY